LIVVGAKKTTPASVVDEVFNHYKTYHAKAQLSDKQKKLISARHKEGYGVDDLKRAIDGNHLSPHHNGQNEQQREYHRLDLIFRDSDKVTDFIGERSQNRILTGDLF
jgi:uncharacterized phage protein (TIGR02220 family)